MTKRITLIGLVVVALALATITLAGPTNFSLDWWTVDGGGGASTGGNYAVSGTVGQTDASLALSGSQYTVTGGFWVLSSAGETLYLPVALKP